jgi:hypothetical protein
MDNFSMLKEKTLTTLRSLFPDILFEIINVKYKGDITAIFIHIPNDETELAKIWEDISNAVAIYYQTQLDSEFDRWNLYLFYLIPTAVEKAIKYKIENDPISSRKIVVDSYNNEPYDTIISMHITNDSISSSGNNESKAKSLKFEKNKIFGTLIDDVSKNKKDDVSKNKKKKNSTEDLQIILSNIEKALLK